MDTLTTQEAAERLGVTVRFGRAHVIREADLKLVVDRPPRRPPKLSPAEIQTSTATTPNFSKSIRTAAEKEMGREEVMIKLRQKMIIAFGAAAVVLACFGPVFGVIQRPVRVYNSSRYNRSRTLMNNRAAAQRAARKTHGKAQVKGKKKTSGREL